MSISERAVFEDRKFRNTHSISADIVTLCDSWLAHVLERPSSGISDSPQWKRWESEYWKRSYALGTALRDRDYHRNFRGFVSDWRSVASDHK